MLDDVEAKDIHGQAALHYAAKNDNVEMIMRLAGKMTNKNIQDEDGNTPLHIAAKEFNLAAIKQLTKHLDGDLAPKNLEGKTPLDLAQDLSVWKKGSDEQDAVLSLLTEHKVKILLVS